MAVVAGPDVEQAVAYGWRLPPPRQRNLRDYRIGYVLDDPLCPVSTDMRRMLVDAIGALRSGGARLTEGWPRGVEPQEEHRNYLLLLTEYVGNA